MADKKKQPKKSKADEKMLADKKKGGELSEEQLDKVAGGFLTYTMEDAKRPK